jgi:hypothetical protein
MKSTKMRMLSAPTHTGIDHLKIEGEELEAKNIHLFNFMVMNLKERDPNLQRDQPHQQTQSQLFQQ